MGPRVSVVLPNYNYARYLKERIRSILQQTAGDLELIYLDDASTDESNGVATEFSSDPRMRMHVFAENSGHVYSRWNDGAQLATGEWLWFAGADDSAHPEFLSHLLKLADRYPSAGIVRCDFLRIDSEGCVIDRAGLDALRRPKDHRSYFERGLKELEYLARYFYPTCSALLIRRDLFLQAGGFNLSVPMGVADVLLYILLASRADFAYSSDVYACYRDHQHSVTRRTDSDVITKLAKCYCTARAIRMLEYVGPGSMPARKRAAREIRCRLNTIPPAALADVPPQAGWMLPSIYEVVPDRRLLRFCPSAS